MENVKPKVVIFNYFLNPKYNFTQNIVDWYESMKKNYLIDCDRQFVVYTDNPNAKDAINDQDIKFVDVDASKTKNIGENKLSKFKYILDCVNQHQFDYFSFIQSNARCVKPVTLSELVGDSPCDLVVFRHCSFPKTSFKGLYCNKVGSTVDISKINTTHFTYVQNSHFIGNRGIILDICGFINSNVDKDYSNPLYKKWYSGKISSVYDERYFNFYLNTKLLQDKNRRIKVLDGDVYIHAPYSGHRDFKINLIDKRKPYKVTSSTPRKISILMASFPYRKKWMLRCMDRLMPQCDNFYLWLNEYKEIPQELDKYDKGKLHVILGEKNLKENGRYVFLENKEIQNDYCFICDDDIEWPKDYVKNAIECFRRNGDNIVLAYFINGGLNIAHLRDEVNNGYRVIGGVEHYRFGAGTCAFVPSLTRFEFTRGELEQHYDMELILAQQCVNNGLKLYSPRRRSNWISFIQDGHHYREIRKHALSSNYQEIENRTRNTYEHMRKMGLVRGKPKKCRLYDFRRFQFG